MVIMKKFWEKFFPYIIAIIPSIVLVIIDKNFIEDKNLNDALNALIMVASLVIGFIGAILPVVMSMRNDSKVRYVFEHDTEKLFLKYIKQTIITGIILILIAFSLYFREQYVDSIYYNYSFALLSYILISFLLCTYRSLKSILNLIFARDNVLDADKGFNYQSKEEIEFENSLKNK